MPGVSSSLNMSKHLTTQLVSLISPKDLLSMSDREIEIVTCAINNEILTNEEINAILQKKVGETMEKL